MAYCTLDDIKKVAPETDLIQLTDDDNLGIIKTTITDAAIEDADDFIDTYLRGRYTLPLSETPKIIAKLSVDLALYYIYERRFKTKMPEGIIGSYNNAIKLLGQIQQGRISLGVDSGTSTGSGEFQTNKTSDSRVFNSDVMDQY
ncbi:MAG: DUF1320 domain-containing protein [Candidatus Edwardsbacteria bacterium]|nr:DUF1320 domain-containing protein [Candidatus Edwardsbacteria bacterium]